MCALRSDFDRDQAEHPGYHPLIVMVIFQFGICAATGPRIGDKINEMATPAAMKLIKIRYL